MTRSICFSGSSSNGRPSCRGESVVQSIHIDYIPVPNLWCAVEGEVSKSLGLSNLIGTQWAPWFWMVEIALPARGASSSCILATYSLKSSQSLENRFRNLRNASKLTHTSKAGNGQSEVDRRCLLYITMRVDSASCVVWTYSVFVTGVPVRHHRYLARSIATALLDRVPLPWYWWKVKWIKDISYRLRMNCDSSVITLKYLILARGPLYQQLERMRKHTERTLYPFSMSQSSSSPNSTSEGTAKSMFNVWYVVTIT